MRLARGNRRYQTEFQGHERERRAIIVALRCGGLLNSAGLAAHFLLQRRLVGDRVRRRELTLFLHHALLLLEDAHDF